MSIPCHLPLWCTLYLPWFEQDLATITDQLLQIFETVHATIIKKSIKQLSLSACTDSSTFHIHWIEISNLTDKKKYQQSRWACGYTIKTPLWSFTHFRMEQEGEMREKLNSETTCSLILLTSILRFSLSMNLCCSTSPYITSSYKSSTKLLFPWNTTYTHNLNTRRKPNPHV